jgi:hypothetical protein
MSQPPEVKTCARCGETKTVDCFHKNKKRVDGSQMYQSQCRICQATRTRERRDENKAKYLYDCRKAKLKKYGLTPEQYDAMHEAQEGLCAICSNYQVGVNSLSVDHCHTTGSVRSLLCMKCNSALGLLNDDPELLTKARHYLLDWKKVNNDKPS